MFVAHPSAQIPMKGVAKTAHPLGDSLAVGRVSHPEFSWSPQRTLAEENEETGPLIAMGPRLFWDSTDSISTWIAA
jgi:hypothetical protein